MVMAVEDEILSLSLQDVGFWFSSYSIKLQHIDIYSLAHTRLSCS